MVYSQQEMLLIAKLATIRVRADSGDRKAKARMAALAREAARLEQLGRRGNAAAARKALVLRESGLLVSSQTFAMEGVTIL
jgi:hypothetical protein